MTFRSARGDTNMPRDLSISFRKNGTVYTVYIFVNAHRIAEWAGGGGGGGGGRFVAMVAGQQQLQHE